MRIVAGVIRLWRKHRDCHLAPRPGAVAPPQLGSEMAEIERGVNSAIGVGQHRGHRVAEKLRVDDFPTAGTAAEFEQPLAGADIYPVRHPLLHQPPVVSRRPLTTG